MAKLTHYFTARIYQLPPQAIARPTALPVTEFHETAVARKDFRR